MQHANKLAEIGRYGLAALAALILLSGPSHATDATLTALSPQPDAGAIESGLAVVYHYGKFNDVSEVDAAAKAGGGEVGKPIARLDLKTSGEVFGSGVKELVGLKIDGLLHFPKPGDWKLVVLSNDGVRVSLADKVILEDPDVHADRYTEPATVVVPAAGWYKLAITYFQKKYTSALQLSWKAPGASDFALIPADAYAHLKSANGGKS